MTNLEEFKIKLSQIFLNASKSNIEKYAKPLLETMHRYDISTSLRQKHFLAQIGHESGELHYSQEIASGDAYEWRRDLGNTQKGDGRKFKGMGLIQLTGRANFSEYDKYRGMNGALIENPKMIIQDPFLSADIAGWFWHSRSINAQADRNDIIGVTKRINGGTRGLAHRRMLFGRASRVLTRAYFPDPVDDTVSGVIEEEKKQEDPRQEKKQVSNKDIQRFLNDYLNIDLDDDGIIGSETKAAIKDLQSKNGLPATGKLTIATKNLISRMMKAE